MRKAIFLDRDGTINIDFGYVYKISDLKFLPRAVQALQILQSLGFLLIIVTNQSGIARGYYNRADYKKITDYLLDVLKQGGVKIGAVYMCPHNEKDECECRKPKIRLYQKAIKKFNIDPEKSYVIGDKTEDIKAGRDLGAHTILVKTGKGGKDKKYKVKPSYIAKNLYEAALWIQKKEKIT